MRIFFFFFFWGGGDLSAQNVRAPLRKTQASPVPPPPPGKNLATSLTLGHLQDPTRLEFSYQFCRVDKVGASSPKKCSNHVSMNVLTLFLQIFDNTTVPNFIHIGKTFKILNPMWVYLEGNNFISFIDICNFLKIYNFNRKYNKNNQNIT